MQITIQPLSRPINGIITLPGSKSYTNRALIMAALYKGKSNIKNYSESNDSLTMIKALNQLGIKIVKHNNQLAIFGNGSQFIPFYKTVNINVGDAGTAMRFLTAFCTLMPGEIILDGSDRMRQRPIGDLVEALKKIGAEIIYLKKIGCPPLKITGGKIQGGLTEIKGSISSQFISALLMVGPVLQKGLQLKIIGSLISRSYIDMTIDSLKHFGVRVANKNNQMFIVKPNEQY